MRSLKNVTVRNKEFELNKKSGRNEKQKKKKEKNEGKGERIDKPAAF